MNDLAKIIGEIEQEWGILSIQDVVWNHAAKDALWLHVALLLFH